ncbi:MAG: hypothetical protein JSW00_19445 [Thermoplasmata archaeon]|nr:MAG: hypothetical protein JSW00_19445 [Thermoplasmata archaeon]
MIGDLIYDFTGGNLLLLLIGVFLIFYFDAMVLTILPEVLILFFFASHPEDVNLITWVVLLLIMAIVGDVSGNYTVYLLFKKVKRYHNWVHDKLRKYVGMLVLKDEKLILLNRVAPALPMCGAFMAACDWSVKRSLFYIFLGGLIKYSVILFLFGFLDWLYPTDTAFWITFISVVVFLAISFFLGRSERKKLMASAKADKNTNKNNEH